MAEKKKLIEDAMKDLAVSPEIMGQFTGQPVFETGRKGTIGDALESVTTAPLRTAISEAQKGNFNKKAVQAVLSQIGKDPLTAPTSETIAEQSGIENPLAKAAIATAVDLAPTPTPKFAGVAGTVYDKGVSNLLRQEDSNLMQKFIRSKRMEGLAEAAKPRDASNSLAAQLRARGAKPVEATNIVGEGRKASKQFSAEEVAALLKKLGK